MAKQLGNDMKALLDEQARIEEARERARRRRHLRFRFAVVIIAVTCLIAIGVIRFSSPSLKVDNGPVGASALTCPSARMKLLGITALSGGLGHGGIVVRALVTSSPACMMSGYPNVGAELTNHSTAMASDVREAYLGGFANVTAPLPRLSITSRSRMVSFTIQWATGNGPTCPKIDVIQIALPGSRQVLTDRPMYNAGGLSRPSHFIYCGNLQVTPVVKGPR